MDSITQIALGAAVGEAVMGRQVGRRALIWGGICGLFPDLDVLIPLGDAVSNFIYHRSASHSLFVLAVLTPLFVWLITKISPDTRVHRNRWAVLVYLAFATHVLLDCLTVYGTQIFWPLPTPPVMWSTIFIIDPVYSVVLFAGVLAALIISRASPRGHWVNTACLVLSTLYLAWSAGAKLHVEQVARSSLQRQGIAYGQLLTVPSPFNTLLWRVLAVDDRHYHEGFYSLFDQSEEIRTTRYPRNTHLLDGLGDHWPVGRLKWFTHGFYAVDHANGDIVITDLRMGLEPAYVFRFKVGETSAGRIAPSTPERVRDQRPWGVLRLVWHRIWSEEARLTLAPSPASNG